LFSISIFLLLNPIGNFFSPGEHLLRTYEDDSGVKALAIDRIGTENHPLTKVHIKEALALTCEVPDTANNESVT
jgi:hypothetical protein